MAQGADAAKMLGRMKHKQPLAHVLWVCRSSEGEQGSMWSHFLEEEMDAQLLPTLPVCCLCLAGFYRVRVHCLSHGWKSLFHTLRPKTMILEKRDEVRPSGGEGV